MSEKYVIELNDEMQLIFKIAVTKNGNADFIYAYKNDLEKLDKYTDEAYQRGLSDVSASDYQHGYYLY